MAQPSRLDKVLIIAPAWVGDMVMAHTLVQCLVAQHPGVQIDMLAPAATAPVAARMPEINRTHQVDFKHGELGFGLRRQVGRELRASNYSCAYVLPNSWKSALVPWFAGIKQRTGWLGEMRYVLLNDHRALDKERYALMIERFMALADPEGALPSEPYPVPKLVADQANADRLMNELNLHRANSSSPGAVGISAPQKIAALCPGAEFGPAKKWPVAHYASLAESLLAQGYAVWLMGSPKDAADSAIIKQQQPECIDLAGRTSLADAIDLLSQADVAVCNDSGLMHIACALEVPTIGVFGSTSPGFTPPLGPHAKVVELDMDCRPCFARECPLGHLNCLKELSPSMVLEQINVG